MGLFKHYNVTPIVVFDGLDLPLKQDTNDERRSNRQEVLKEGLTFYSKREIGKAKENFKKSVTITHDMIVDVLKELSAEKIQCIVAPNEADAQLTHLAKTGKVDAVITEDSDLLAFGCPKIIYKMNFYGQGTEITMDQVINDENSVFYNYDIETIRHICILSGCDYLPSIKQVSFTTILEKYKQSKDTYRILYNLQYKYKKDIPRDYFEKFYLANLGFLHQWVYDIDEKNYVRLNPLPKECSDDDIELLGRIPTVQDSTMFSVNEIIPKTKPKDNPLKEAITMEFLAYVDSTKENIMPEHLASPFLLPLPKSSESSKSTKSTKSTKSSKSPESPTSSKMKPRRMMGDRLNQINNHNPQSINDNLQNINRSPQSSNPQNNNVISPVMNALDIRSSESSSSMPKVLTQSDRLETFYRKFHVFPRKSRKAIVESATPSMTATSENANSTPQSDDRYALPTTSAIPSAELTQSNGEELQIWKSYQEKNPIPHHDALHSAVKQASQNTECTTTMHKPSSSLKRSVSFFHEPLKDRDDTPEFSLPAPSSPTAPVNQSLSPPFTASEITMPETAVPENADSGSPPSTLAVENEQLSSSISDTVSSPATATQGGQTSKYLSKKKTDPRLAKLHTTVKQSSQNMKNTRAIHKPLSSLKRSVSFFHEPLMDHDDTPKFSLPAPSSPTAPVNQSLSPPFTASETTMPDSAMLDNTMPENADSGSPPSPLTTETEQLSSSIPDIMPSPAATAIRSSQASKSLSKKKTDPRLAKLHTTVKQSSQNMKNTRTIHKPLSSLKRSVSFFHEPLKYRDDTPEFSLPAPSSPTAPVNQSLSPPFTASEITMPENAMPENADSGSPPSTLAAENEQLSSSIPDTVSSPATATQGGQTSKSLSKKKTDPRLAKLHTTLFHEPLKDRDDTPEFSLPAPSSPTAPANQSLSPPFTASEITMPENAMPENADSGSPPSPLTTETEQLSSSIPDIMPSPAATAIRSSQASKSLSKKKTDPCLAKLHTTVKQSSQNMKNTKAIHKPSSSSLKRSASFFHESLNNHTYTHESSLPTPSSPTAPAYQSLSPPPFTASETAVPKNAASGSPLSTLAAENKQLSSSIPDTVSSPATATQGGQTSKSLSKKKTDPRLVKSHNTVKK
ncbi:Rad2 nuclease [Mucor circinelloides]